MDSLEMFWGSEANRKSQVLLARGQDPGVGVRGPAINYSTRTVLRHNICPLPFGEDMMSSCCCQGGAGLTEVAASFSTFKCLLFA